MFHFPPLIPFSSAKARHEGRNLERGGVTSRKVMCNFTDERGTIKGEGRWKRLNLSLSLSLYEISLDYLAAYSASAWIFRPRPGYQPPIVKTTRTDFTTRRFESNCSANREGIFLSTVYYFLCRERNGIFSFLIIYVMIIYVRKRLLSKQSNYIYIIINFVFYFSQQWNFLIEKEYFLMYYNN